MKYSMIFIIFVHYQSLSNVFSRSARGRGNRSSSQVEPDRKSEIIKYHSDQKPIEYLMFLYEVFEVLSSDGVEKKLNDESNGCLFVKSEENIYSYKSQGSNDVCGLYVIAQPSQAVEFQFFDFDISCHNGGLLSVIDGWELNGQFFPSEKDHSLSREKRYTEYCGDKVPYTRFVTQQNVGLIEFRIPSKHEGFRVKVSFHTNPTPCNVLVEIGDGTHVLSNFGKRINCTLTVLFPSSFGIRSLQIGSPAKMTECQSKDRENKLLHGDFLEIRGGNGLDSHLMTDIKKYCGHSAEPGPSVEVPCSVASVTLISSGRYNNSATIDMEFLFDLDSSLCPYSN